MISKTKRQRKDLSGLRFGRLKAVNVHHINKFNRQAWLCECECGVVKIIDQNALISGSTLSCGCLGVELRRKALRKHGMATTQIYRSWQAMMRRCNNSKDRAYHNYGGRGIRVCEEWHDVVRFAKDMAETYKPGLEIDRIDNNGNYCAENCKWSSPKEQANNKRTNRIVKVDGKSITLSQCAEKVGIKYVTLLRRLRIGMSIEDAISIPVRRWGSHVA